MTMMVLLLMAGLLLLWVAADRGGSRPWRLRRSISGMISHNKKGPHVFTPPLQFKIKDQLTRSESDELARTLKQLRLLAVQEFAREIQFSKKTATDLAHYAIPHDALIQLPFAAKDVGKAARLVAKIRHLVDNPRRTDLVVASPKCPGRPVNIKRGLDRLAMSALDIGARAICRAYFLI